MADVTVRRLDGVENNHGVYYRLRAGLGVTSFGLSLERWPAGSAHFPEHDEAATGQEDVYVVLAGSGVLHAGGEEHALAPGVAARVAPGVRRRIVPGGDGIELLCIGGVPGAVYAPPAFTEAGAPWR